MREGGVKVCRMDEWKSRIEGEMEEWGMDRCKEGRRFEGHPEGRTEG